jgi:N-sulfoglucosamine sulfohydrolase
LMEELKSTGDPRLIEDGKFFETPPMSGPLQPYQEENPKGKNKGKEKSK